LRFHVAYVGQQGAGGAVIFNEKSAFENISAAVHGHSSRLPSLKEAEEACRAALMHGFVRDLPQGYDTLIGGGAGVGLSGGQLQHLSIARARLRNPTVLILGMFLYLNFVPETWLTKYHRRGNVSPRFYVANSRLRSSQATAAPGIGIILCIRQVL
jgi:hypothetical protein